MNTIGNFFHNMYSLHPNMIVLIPGFFCPKMIVQFLCDLLNEIKKTFNIGLDIRGSRSSIFEGQSHHQEDLRHRNFWVCFEVVVVFYFERYTYNYAFNDKRALISPK